MRTAWHVDEVGTRVEAGMSERAATPGLVAILTAIAAALLFLVGSAWFASGAGADYPDQVTTSSN